MEIKRLFDILPYRQEHYGDNGQAVFYAKVGKEWKPCTLAEYSAAVHDLSCALLHFGLAKGDRVALISNSRPEWNIVDMAVMRAGGITVPIYATINAEDTRYIFEHAEVRFVFIEDNRIWRKISSFVPEIASIETVYSFVSCEGCRPFEEALEAGRQHADDALLAAREAEVTTDDVACLMYTSGTTGVPKGVLQTHKGIILNINGVKNTPTPACRIAFSFLPLCHAYEKLLVYLYQYLGMSVYYAQNLGTIVDNLKEVHPNMMTAVPRVLEKMYNKFYSAGESLHGFSKKLYYWAFRLSEKYKTEGNGWFYKCKLAIADRLIYSKWRAAVGAERFEIVVSGGSALKPSMAAFFSAIHMPVFEGYGLTETSPVVSVHNSKKHGRLVGTVGQPIDGVEVRIAEDGEVVCRGDNVMLGYYKNEELTREYIDADGWFHTGDLGRIGDYGHLIITGRKKSLFKTSFGKYVNPDIIELKCMESPFIEQMVVFGENQKFAAALIQPDFTYLKIWCTEQQIPTGSVEEMLASKAVRKRYQEELDGFNASFSEHERIKKFALVGEEWTQENGILTPTLKVKRKVVASRYADEIDALFA
ncbi:MAG: long-chain fatty acid--CoA ligase [Bacteroidales bacterium]|nr:long-chain fatty acid--CoA ligase [Bacteroidales bacterium]